jgi:hypothetical protein
VTACLLSYPGNTLCSQRLPPERAAIPTPALPPAMSSAGNTKRKSCLLLSLLFQGRVLWKLYRAVCDRTNWDSFVAAIHCLRGVLYTHPSVNQSGSVPFSQPHHTCEPVRAQLQSWRPSQRKDNSCCCSRFTQYMHEIKSTFNFCLHLYTFLTERKAVK